MYMAVAKKSDYVITLLPGDGIGPEIIAATLPCLNAVANKHGFKFTFREADIGGMWVTWINQYNYAMFYFSHLLQELLLINLMIHFLKIHTNFARQGTTKTLRDAFKQLIESYLVILYY